jgi:antitoxin HigA-1
MESRQNRENLLNIDMIYTIRGERMCLVKGILLGSEVNFPELTSSDLFSLPQVRPDAKGQTRYSIANHIGVLPKTINEICRGKRGISADMAMKLSKALGGSPQFWLNLQNHWELCQVDEASFEGIQPVAAELR